MKTEVLIDWIVHNFHWFSKYINKIAIYGSIARRSGTPHDCDLLIVSNANVESVSWFSLRQHISSMRIDFSQKFGLPLNVTLLTEGEWSENKSFYKDLLIITL